MATAEHGRLTRVALLSFDFAEYCLRLAKALTSGADVLMLLPAEQVEPHRDQLSRLSCDTHLFHKPRLRQPVRQVTMSAELTKRLRDFAPDVLHLQQGHAWFNLALPFVRSCPLVVTIHDPRHHLGDREGRKHPQAIYDFGFRRASELIVHSQKLKDEVLDRIGVSSERVHVIPHIRLGRDLPVDDEPVDGQTILFFGRIWEYKGLEYLIKAEPLITAKVPTARVVIAGTGEDFTRYRAMMVHPERFEVINEYVPDERRAELFRAASVVVLPYVDASQSGIVPLAYSFGKPVVATTVGGLPEIVEDGQTGLLVPPRDERSLAAAVVSLLEDAAVRRQLGLNGKRKLNAECAEEVIAHQTLAVYAAALERGRRARIVKEAAKS